jgi:hypothetical protein
MLPISKRQKRNIGQICINTGGAFFKTFSTGRLLIAQLQLGLGIKFMLILILAAVNVSTTLLAEDVPVVLPTDAPTNEQLAARDLTNILGQLYPKDRFFLSTALPVTGKAILLGQASDALGRPYLGHDVPAMKEAFVVHTYLADDLKLGVIAGADARGTAYGVYQLLSQLGCGFGLSGDMLPPPKEGAFDFTDWNLENHPLTRERIVFEWHNFLSGCSTWNFADWQRWIAQSQKMGFNTVMVHAYGNNPMTEFSFDGISKPVGWLSTTIKGRDWNTMHVNDVRRLFGGEVFTQSAFGADAALVSDDQRVSAIQSLMQHVFAEAARHDMGVCFAVDVDTLSANSQELVLQLPESARFKAGGLWLPNPDTPEGCAFYRAQVETLVKTYPEITELAVWFRRGKTPWMDLKTTDLPPTWQKEFADEVRQTPPAEKFWHAPGLFAIGKIVGAFDRALKECGANQITLAAGSWGFNFLSAADRFFPKGVPLIGLDYDVIFGKSALSTAESRTPLREVGAHRPVIPIMWAQHDDGRYFGRPFEPPTNLASKLEDANAAGFGIIHWMTRPLDLYFASLAKQVWKSTKDQPLPETCDNFAAPPFGVQNRELMGSYLMTWMTDAPQFGRETSDWFMDHQLTNVVNVIAGCRGRLAMIAQAQTAELTPEQSRRLDYQRGLEEFIVGFYKAQDCFQQARDLLNSGDIAGAQKLIAGCHPEQVVEQFSRDSSIGGITRGEQGLIVSLNTRWLTHFVSLRQAIGLEPVRIRFAATSHDPLAQSPGKYTFYFGPNHEIWECWGKKETGAEVVSLPPPSFPTNGASLTTSLKEVAQSGIEIAKPLALTLRPIMEVKNQGLEKLPAGGYHLHLWVAAPNAAEQGQAVFQIKIDDLPAERVDMFRDAVQTNSFAELVKPVALRSAGAVRVTLAPVTGKVICCGAVLEPDDLTSPDNETTKRQQNTNNK